MKKLVMVSEESIFAGVVKSGMAELTDSLANSLSVQYAVTVVCPDGDGVFARATSDLRRVSDTVRKCRFSRVNYVLIDVDAWWYKPEEIVDELQPDILHNMADVTLLSRLKVRPPKSGYTFDNAQILFGKDEHVRSYDFVNTISEAYAAELLEGTSALAQTLRDVGLKGLTAGILDTVINPRKGILLQAKYGSDDLTGKEVCKKRLLETYGIQGDPCVYLMMCRLSKEKGLEEVFEVAEQIRDSGGVLVVAGRGVGTYEAKLKELSKTSGVIYINRFVNPVQAAPLTSGADFYLSPSLHESCGLMPMTAAHYGAIPIVTLNGGLRDNFDDSNAIVIGDRGLAEAIDRAAALYQDKDAMTAMRKVCMEQDYSWATRKQGYIELYEK